MRARKNLARCLRRVWTLSAGDVVVFRGDQRHSYANPGHYGRRLLGGRPGPRVVKQHLLVDVAAGVPWGLAAYWVAGRWYRRVVPPGEDVRDALLHPLQ